MVFHVTGNILRAGAINGRMHFHVCVNNVQVDLFILYRGHKEKAFLISFHSRNNLPHSWRPHRQKLLGWRLKEFGNSTPKKFLSKVIGRDFEGKNSDTGHRTILQGEAYHIATY